MIFNGDLYLLPAATTPDLHHPRQDFLLDSKSAPSIHAIWRASPRRRLFCFQILHGNSQWRSATSYPRANQHLFPATFFL